MLATEIMSYFGGLKAYAVEGLGHDQLDVGSMVDVQEALDRHRPAVVVNTAAMHVEDCEDDPQKAWVVNTLGARNLAVACTSIGATIVHISTGGLFGDEIREYHEYDPVELKTSYAKSKWRGEEEVRRSCENHYVLRLGWLYGGDIEHTKNFVAARYRECQKNIIVESANDKFGSPTYTGDVARWICYLLDSHKFGLYHISNSGGCSRAEYVGRIIQEFGLPNQIVGVDSSQFPRKADVPDCEMLTSLNLEKEGFPQLPQWEESLSRYVQSIRGRFSRL